MICLRLWFFFFRDCFLNKCKWHILFDWWNLWKMWVSTSSQCYYTPFTTPPLLISFQDHYHVDLNPARFVTCPISGSRSQLWKLTHLLLCNLLPIFVLLSIVIKVSALGEPGDKNITASQLLYSMASASMDIRGSPCPPLVILLRLSNIILRLLTPTKQLWLLKGLFQRHILLRPPNNGPCQTNKH